MKIGFEHSTSWKTNVSLGPTEKFLDPRILQDNYIIKDIFNKKILLY